MPITHTNNKRYRQTPLRELLVLIIDEGDRSALSEFHTHRQVFGDTGSQTTRFSDYIEQLISAFAANHSSEALQFARDQTVDRFSKLSDTGIDCRSYLRSALSSTVRINDEAVLCYRLTGLARRHFRLGLKEAYRNGTRTRYTWQRNSESIELLFPKEFSGDLRRQWLEQHAADVNPSGESARQTIQQRIDSELGYSMQDSLDVSDALGAKLSAPGSPHDYLDRISVSGLSSALADEKVEHIDDQRPAIRNLGATMLGQLIQEIFSAIDTDRYEEKQLALQFGLSTATFSRFAGSRWHSGNKPMPDLWRNLAQLLSFDVRFAGLCADAGIIPFLNSTVTEEDPA